MNDFEKQVIQMLEASQEETRRLSQQIATFENDMQKKVELVLEGQKDNNRQVEKLQTEMEAVQGAIANAVIVKAVS